jgi:hypothetical protein
MNGFSKKSLKNNSLKNNQLQIIFNFIKKRLFKTLADSKRVPIFATAYNG